MMDKHCLKCDLCYNLRCPDYVVHDDPAIISVDSYKILEDEVIELNNLLAQAEAREERVNLAAKANLKALKQALANNARLREALEFYADTGIYEESEYTVQNAFDETTMRCDPVIMEDKGSIARNALDKLGGEE